jgi:hypothetical protein
MSKHAPDRPRPVDPEALHPSEYAEAEAAGAPPSTIAVPTIYLPHGRGDLDALADELGFYRATYSEFTPKEITTFDEAAKQSNELVAQIEQEKPDLVVLLLSLHDSELRTGRRDPTYYESFTLHACETLLGATIPRPIIEPAFMVWSIGRPNEGYPAYDSHADASERLGRAASFVSRACREGIAQNFLLRLSEKHTPAPAIYAWVVQGVTWNRSFLGEDGMLPFFGSTSRSLEDTDLESEVPHFLAIGNAIHDTLTRAFGYYPAVRYQQDPTQADEADRVRLTAIARGYGLPPRS